MLPQAAKPNPSARRENTPDPFSIQEIDDAILSGVAIFEKDWQEIESAFGAQTMRQTLALVWSKMTPEQKAHFQQADPALYKQATELFGK